jgi:hypothetical protein
MSIKYRIMSFGGEDFNGLPRIFLLRHLLLRVLRA